MYTLHHGDCLEVLQTLPDNSVDSIVTDPPAGIAFMNMQWDKDKGGRDVWIAWMEKVAKQCLRIIKPGGHALVWSLPRTSHWTGTAWENAGWEPRDKIYFLFGTGFPKSMNIGKQIDKMRGAIKIPITAPATEEAKQWDGWGTGLKPASEEWWLFRKPISESTITDNVLHWGTGGLNIDGCRIELDDASKERAGKLKQRTNKPSGRGLHHNPKSDIQRIRLDREIDTFKLSGRWPANVVHDGSDEVVEMFPDVKAGTAVRKNVGVSGAGWKSVGYADTKNDVSYNDSGSAARFFYGAKASVRDRDEGLSKSDTTTTRANIHPTVKSTELMRYLCRLITPPHGIVLDPFTGSGSTGKGALKEGFQFIGIEMDEEYVTIARARLEHVLQQKGSS
jgi:site-specific DNA-methyltransferase (adenine-specific)